MKKIITPHRAAILLAILCLGGALLIRLWNLELKPLHHDEGVNGWFILRLYNNNFFRYDPSNYHGPFLFYLGLIPFYLGGISTFMFRLMPALFGSLTIAILLALRGRIGLVGVITAGVLLAFSPANVFYSRYTIHETYLIFFTLGAVVTWALFVGTNKPTYLLLTAASLAFMITVKETYIVTLGIFAISLVLSWLLNFLLKGIGPNVANSIGIGDFKRSLTDLGRTIWQRAKEQKVAVILSTVLFATILFLFYSSFFTYFKGLEGLLSTLKIWTKTGLGGTGHEKPFPYYFEILYRVELPILVFASLGLLYSFWKRDTFSLFLSFWGIGSFLAYSLIPYKTPWLITNMITPMALLAGVFLQGVTASLVGIGGRIVFATLFLTVVGYSAYQAVDLNFRRYDDNAHDLVYVHTYRDVNGLVDRINSLAKIADGYKTAINVVSPEHWPLEWYLRDYSHIAYWGKVIDQPDSPLIIGIDRERSLLESRLQGDYHKENYRLRPGVNLVLYIQGSLWKEWFLESIKEGERAEISPGEVIENGLVGNYYRGADFAGEVILTRSESGLDFNWTGSRPTSGAFSAEWEGFILIDRSGKYTFTSESDDGSWIYLDEKLVVDNSGHHPIRRASGSVNLSKGNHRIRVRYFDGGGEALLRLLWQPPGGRETLIPKNVIYSLRERKILAAKPQLEGKTAAGLWGRYYRGVDFAGESFLNQADTDISFHWNLEEEKPFRSPFSVEWEGYLLIREDGVYRFTTESDDGSWLYLDEELVVDNSGYHPIRRSSGTVNLTSGYHYIRIRYFDGGGGAILHLLWQPPAEGEAPIPSESLYYITPE